jgi:hypothetical protein
VETLSWCTRDGQSWVLDWVHDLMKFLMGDINGKDRY